MSNSPFPKPQFQENDFVPPNPLEYLKGMVDTLKIDVKIVEPELQEISLYASGGIGEIYSAKDTTLGRVIALKTLNPHYQYDEEQMERLVREAQAAAQLEHPNIVPIHSLGISPSKGMFFSMKRLRGDSLRHIINQLAEQNPGYTREYTFAARINIFIKICQGISYAHSKGVIHRDLKPENVLVGNFGEVTIIDWGLVKQMEASHHAPKHASAISTTANETSKVSAQIPLDSLSQTMIMLPQWNPTVRGEVQGTPRFMSPEQTFGNRDDVDTRTDIYALGVILYELLTFTNPFNSLTKEDDIVNAVTRGQYLPPRQTSRAFEISPELEAICLKAMHVNKENRYQAVGEIIKDLMAHMEGRPVSAYNAPIHVKIHKLFRRNPIKTSIILSSICAIIAFVSASNVISAWNAEEIIQKAKHDIKLATQRLKSVESQLLRRESQLAANQTDIEFDDQLVRNGLDAVDNWLISANLLLSNVASQNPNMRNRIQIIRENMFNERLIYTLNHGDFNEMQKIRGLIFSLFGDNTLNRSSSLKGLLTQLDSAISGRCTLSILSQSDYASFSLRPFQNNTNGGKVLGPPVELPQNTVPASQINIPKGTYQLTFTSAGKPDLKMYISMTHGEHAVINLTMPSSIPDGTVFIPEGKITIPKTLTPEEANVYSTTAPPFFIAVHEVTNREYLTFWKSIADYDLKQKYRSCIWLSATSGYAVDAWDDEGNLKDFERGGKPLITLDTPVTGISQAAANAFCQWKGQQMNCVCRLPTSAEWLRAATGDDSRKYPWGDDFIASHCLTAENTQGKDTYPLFAPPGSFAHDISPYGVMDMAGNVREWTATTFTEIPDLYQIKGASAATSKRCLPLSNTTDFCTIPSDIGFRYVLEYQDSLESVPAQYPSEQP